MILWQKIVQTGKTEKRTGTPRRGVNPLFPLRISFFASFFLYDLLPKNHFHEINGCKMLNYNFLK
jgi:hypothetical protein